jgi:hypothetical protein
MRRNRGSAGALGLSVLLPLIGCRAPIEHIGEAHDVWRASEIRDYRMVVEKWCPSCKERTFEVVVKDDTLAAIIEAWTEVSREEWWRFRPVITINDLFAYLMRLQADAAGWQMRGAFDVQFGYPDSVEWRAEFSPAGNVTDTQDWYKVIEFSAGP